MIANLFSHFFQTQQGQEKLAVEFGMLMQYNDSCSRSFREHVYCSSISTQDEKFFVEKDLFSLLCFEQLTFRLCVLVHKNDPNKCTTARATIIRELVNANARGVLMILFLGWGLTSIKDY